MRLDFRHAASEASLRHSAWLRAVMEEGFRRAGERIEDRKDKDEAERAETAEFLETIVLVAATEAQIAAFEERVELHDEAIIKALLENQEALDAANERVEQLLGEAYVLEDGRRVFKTEDGKRAFDENGEEVSAEELDVELIEDHRPRWETFKAAKETREALTEERREILRHQERIDDARERLEQGDLSEDDLNELEDILSEAPDAVKRQLPKPEAALLDADQEPGLDSDQRPHISPQGPNSNPVLSDHGPELQ